MSEGEDCLTMHIYIMKALKWRQMGILKMSSDWARRAHQENLIFNSKCIEGLDGAWSYLKLLKLFNVLVLAWWATWKKFSQVTTSTVKQYQVHISNGLKGNLIADFTQYDSIYWSSSSQLAVKSGQVTWVRPSHSSWAQASIFKHYKILLEIDLRNCSSTVKHPNQIIGFPEAGLLN